MIDIAQEKWFSVMVRTIAARNLMDYLGSMIFSINAGNVSQVLYISIIKDY